jgi:hypothetical protein
MHHPRARSRLWEQQQSQRVGSFVYGKLSLLGLVSMGRQVSRRYIQLYQKCQLAARIGSKERQIACLVQATMKQSDTTNILCSTVLASLAPPNKLELKQSQKAQDRATITSFAHSTSDQDPASQSSDETQDMKRDMTPVSCTTSLPPTPTHPNT